MPLQKHFDQEQPSEEVQEIIGSVPHWLIRWGITLFFAVLLLILAMSALIKSPDMVSAKLRIGSETLPQEVLARKTGKLRRLFVSQDEKVDSGQVLGYLESNAKHEDVLSLSLLIDHLQSELLRSNFRVADTLNVNTTAQYGELQPAFQEFYLSFLQFKAYSPRGIYARKVGLIQGEIENLRRLREQLSVQKSISEADYAIQAKEFAAFEQLAKAKVISPLEFKREESKFLNKKLPVESSQSALINNNSSRTLKEKELLETESLISEQRAAFMAKIQRFKSEIDRWKFETILVSDRAGKVLFHRLLEEQEWLEVNTPVMYIADGRAEKKFGELILGQYSFGKIRKGQEVLIRLNAYPHQEFGLLRGEITYMSNVLSGDTTFTAKVTLPEGLKSTYNKSLTLRSGLVAQAQVVTESKSLLARIFNSLRSAVENSG